MSIPLRIYSFTGCPHCEDAKNYLDSKQIEYEDIDLLDPVNEEYIDEVISDGNLAVPKICKKEEPSVCIIGFDKKKIDKLVSTNHE